MPTISINGINREYLINDNGCHIWLGCLNSSGYGQVKINRGVLVVHKYLYERSHGTVLTGLELDHKCKNRACFNLEHLEPVTHRVNMFRARKTHCKNGHEFTPDNTKTRKAGVGRRCKKCSDEKSIVKVIKRGEKTSEIVDTKLS